ncbi:MAG: PD-(D/E)XK nuclease family protein [bacterium]
MSSLPQRSSQTELFAGENFTALWEEAIRLWLKNAVAQSWRDHRPTSILCPSVAWLHFLKEKMAAGKMGALALHFWLPADARAFLIKKLTPELQLGDASTFRLLLSAACLEEKDSLSQTLAADASSLWQAMELASSAGVALPKANQGRFQKFCALKSKARLMEISEADTALLKLSKEQSRPLQNILLVGFSSAHWPLWNLLRATIQSSDQSAVCLPQPRVESEKMDMLWLSSWEQFLGAAHFCALPDASEETSAPATIFRVALSLRKQAEAAVSQVAAFLREAASLPRCRVGIVVSGPGVLAREIAVLLDEMNIPHHDTVGHLTPPAPDEDAWQAWLAQQREPILQTLLALLRLAPQLTDLPIQQIESLFYTALGETMTNDIAIALAYWSASSSSNERILAENLQHIRDAWQPFNETACLGDFLNQTIRALRCLEWEERAFVEALRKRYENCLDIICSRRAFLKWLQEQSETRQRARASNGSHLFAPVHLLSYAEAEGQEWSHLILTGLNEDEWPRAFALPPWLTEEIIQEHNLAAVTMGKQGAGHEVIKEGKGICFGPSEWSSLQHRQFQCLTDSAARSLCCLWSLSDESEPSRVMQPSDCLASFYSVKTEKILDDNEQQLARQMQVWLDHSSPPLPLALPPADLTQTAEAYLARWNSNAPFGIYDFALKQPPPQQIQLACKEFEDTFRQPALVWMKKFLGVQPDREPVGWPITQGVWAHRWLSHAVNPAQKQKWIVRESAEKFRNHLVMATEQTRLRMETIFQQTGRSLSGKWLAAWNEARSCAAELLESVLELSEWSEAKTEWRLPPHFSVPLKNGSQLLLSGQIDLALSLSKQTDERALAGSVWILDYKTGDSGLRINPQTGAGLQLALYGLACCEADEISVSFVQPGQKISALWTKENFLAHDFFWQGLARLQQTGIFGMRGKVYAEFGFGRKYPLAMLPVDEELLEKKWELTHPLLARA